MAIICPTITVETKEDYDRQLVSSTELAPRIHIDLSDTTLAPRRLLGLSEMHWPDHAQADLHIMSKQPAGEVETALSLKPHLVILHAEADCDFLSLAQKLHSHQIKFGLALLPETPVSKVEQLINELDHLLIFSGNLGYQGGSFADLSLLGKLNLARQIKPELEIGWDGGVNQANISDLAAAKVDVLNVGGFIQHSPNPREAYAKLEASLKKPTDAPETID